MLGTARPRILGPTSDAKQICGEPRQFFEGETAIEVVWQSPLISGIRAVWGEPQNQVVLEVNGFCAVLVVSGWLE